ncbi:succinate-semialdehyde dehydrogenase (NADP(+)) [Svornostia abyssi]|uniref:Succinate-semialdehyde dehydrogenase (NADP(+)) n=1 Tax=Svornostia abyssi TaxID=2898438 RepID=A0ABY5PJI5_9ACTN|nr:succinate-semialdehyde dehydrogenase (NADP(+)) [Parviterribacteraceae bacterium J379]
MSSTAATSNGAAAATNGTSPAKPQTASLPSTGSALIDGARLQRLAGLVQTEGPREMREVEAPFTGQTIGSVPMCDEADLAAALDRARAAQARWAKTSFAERKAILLRFHDLVLDRQNEALDLLQIEAGKARRQAHEEVLDTAIVARYYANTGEKHLRTQRRQGALPVLTQVWQHHHPIGVVAIIAPWNYPLTLAISDATPALMAGNAVVLKPDQQTPFCALWGVELLREAGMPADLFQVVTGSGARLGKPMIEGSDYIMFTGSTATGRTVASQAGEQLIPCSMELGGKNAMLVCEDADIGKAVDGAERALFGNAGQLCISIERVLVHEKVADEFTRRLAQRIGEMRLDTDLSWKADMGSLISQSQLDTVRAHIEDAVKQGATVVAGGKARPDIGPYFHEPTLLDNVGEGMTCFREETFGPVVAISRFSDEDEAIARANDTPYGLNSSVWTKDTARGRKIAARLRTGTVNVNEGYIATWGSTDAPMGGMGDSGLGRRHGAEGIKKYTESQGVAVQRLIPIAPVKPMTPAMWAKVMTLGLRILKRTPGIK